GLARLDRRLGDVRDTILVVGHLDAVEMDDGRFGQLVLEDDPHAVSLADPDLRPGYLPVVRPGFGALARLHLPLDLRRGQVEDLHSAFHSWREGLVALALGGRGERLDPLLVHGVHLIGELLGRLRRRGWW